MTVKVTIIGNATADAEVRVAPKGDLVTSFTLAVNDRVQNDAGEWVDGDKPAFYSISVWPSGGASGAAEAVKKGNRVMVEGTMKIRSYTTKEGVDRTAMEVTASEVALSTRFMGARKTEPRSAALSDAPF